MKNNNYRKIYENHHNVKIPKFMEIHHLDGDHTNNNIDNLKLVTVQEHYDIHYSQGDYGACWMIQKRLTLSESEKSIIASLAATKANKEGKSGFGLGHAAKAGKIGGKKSAKYAMMAKINIFGLSHEKEIERKYKFECWQATKIGRASLYPRGPDPIKYNFINIKNNQTRIYTAFELAFELNIDVYRVVNIIKNKKTKTGKSKSVLGWAIL